MTDPLQTILTEPDDSELCNRIHGHIISRHGAHFSVAELTEEERVVVLVCQARGIIDNGGFRHLFEGNFDGDPLFAGTHAALRTIGAEAAAQAFQATLSMFPDSRPPVNVQERMRVYLTQVAIWPTEADKKFWDAGKQTDACLARYIRAHADAFLRQDAVTMPAAEEPAAPQAVPPSSGPLDELPHWQRVAFAARCARCVLPLLSRFWPDIPGERLRSVERAIELAEQSAKDEKQPPDLKEAHGQAVMVAGAAIWTDDFGAGRPNLEPKPRNALEGEIASLVASSAAKAALAAESSPAESGLPAIEAWSFAREAATAANDEDMIGTLHRLHAEYCPSPPPESGLQQDQALIRRGRLLLLAFSTPMVLFNLATILLAVLSDRPVNLWSDVLYPAGFILAMYGFWIGDAWLCWLLPPLFVATGGLRLFRLVRDLQLHVPLATAQTIVMSHGIPMAAAFFDILGGLVFLFSPSVNAFFRSQRRKFSH